MALQGFAQGEVMPFLPGESSSFPEALRGVLQCCLQGLPFLVPQLGWENASSEADFHSWKKNPIVPRNPMVS